MFCLGLWQGTALAADPLAPAEDAAAAVTSGDVAGATQEVVETEAPAPAEEVTAEPAPEPVTQSEPVADARAKSTPSPDAGIADVGATDAAAATQDIATDVSDATEQAALPQVDEPASPQVNDPAASTEAAGGAAESSGATTTDSGGTVSVSTEAEQDVVSQSAAVVQEAAADVAGSAGAVNDGVNGAAQTRGSDNTAVVGTSVLEEAAQPATDVVSATASDALDPEPSDAPVLVPIGDTADSSDPVADVTAQVVATQEAVTGEAADYLSDGVDKSRASWASRSIPSLGRRAMFLPTSRELRRPPLRRSPRRCRLRTKTRTHGALRSPKSWLVSPEQKQREVWGHRRETVTGESGSLQVLLHSCAGSSPHDRRGGDGAHG